MSDCQLIVFARGIFLPLSFRKCLLALFGFMLSVKEQDGSQNHEKGKSSILQQTNFMVKLFPVSLPQITEEL